MVSLKTLKPTVVSKDLKGKFVFIYGPPKIGKTTLATQFPRNLLLAVEHGQNVLNDIFAVEVPTWGEFLGYVQQLADPDIMSMYDTVTIDTVGLLYDRCEAYVCAREGVEKIGDIPFGAGYKMVDSEFDNAVRKITQYADPSGRQAYGLCFIGHEKVKSSADGTIGNISVSPDISDRCARIINRMVDITAYIGMEDGVRYIYPRQTTIKSPDGKTTEIYAGSHFAGLNDKIELSYTAFVNAIAEAMEANIAGLTDDPLTVTKTEKPDFKETKNAIGKIARALKLLDDEESEPHYMSDMQKITVTYLGRKEDGTPRLVKECTEDQIEHLVLILNDLNAYINMNGIEV